MLDSVPTVFITGQVKTHLIGTDGFQEADILGATLPFVKHSFQVTDAGRSPSTCTRPSTSPPPGAPARC